MDASVIDKTSQPVVSSDRRRDRLQDTVDGGFADRALPAFDAIMGALRVSNDSGHARSPVASPSQMFEPDTSNSHEARVQALKTNDREGRLTGNHARDFDSTSIAARRAERVIASRGDSTEDILFKSRIDAPRNEFPSQPAERGGDRVDRMAFQDARADARGGSLDRHSSVGRSGREEASAPRSDSPAGSQSQTDRSQFGTDHSPAPVGLSGIQGKGMGSVSAAGRVAEILSTGRIGEADAVRSPSVVSTVQGARNHIVRDGATGQSEKGGADTGDGSRPTSSTSGASRSDFEDLIRSIRLFSGPRHSTARIHLDPPDLGHIRVDLRMTDHELQIIVLTDTAEAKAVLQERADLLRTALGHYGIHIDRFDIDTETDTERVFAGDVDHGNDDLKSSFAGTRREPARAFNAPDDARVEDAPEKVEPDSVAYLSDAGEWRLDIRV